MAHPPSRKARDRKGFSALREEAWDELAALRLKLARTSQQAAPDSSRGATDPRRSRTRGSASQALDDTELFRRAVGAITPIRGEPRAEPSRPKPAPERRWQREDEGPDATASSNSIAPAVSDAALVKRAFADVTPLRDSGRAEVSGNRPSAIPRSSRPGPDHLQDKLTGLPDLPAETADLDAASLFRLATRGAQPLTLEGRAEAQLAPPKPEPVKRLEDEVAAMRDTMEAPISLEDRLDMGEEAAFLRPGMPKRVLVDLRRGRWVLQGELDLHGFNREEARAALGQFLSTSLSRGQRCVRIIHGKGLGSPGRESILKQLSRGWLAQREEILAFCQAGAHRGGAGALIVLLRGSNTQRP